MPIHKGMLETWNMYMSEGKKSREKDAVQKIYRRGMRWSGLCNPQGGKCGSAPCLLFDNGVRSTKYIYTGLMHCINY